jgi:hypothetical protein
LFKKYSAKSLVLILSLGVCLAAQCALGYTANQVSFEFRQGGTYRVNLYYTIPALREFREAYIDFNDRKQAERFYFDVVKGADFYVDSQGQVDFNNSQTSPSPW